MTRSLLLSLFVFSRVLVADINAFEEVAGGFPVYAIDGNENFSGVVELAVSAEGVGFKLSELQGPLEDQPAMVTSLLTPKAGTTVTKEGTQIIQEYLTDDLNIRIEYERKGPQVEIQASQCRKNAACQLTLINTGVSAGDEMVARDFFKSIEGKYTIEKVGPGEPHGPKIADVAVGDEEANLTMPYCADSGGACDPGYIDLTLAETKVLKKSVARGHVLATILSDGKRYTWEERAGRYFFRNYQYETFFGEKIVLTHEMKK